MTKPKKRPKPLRPAQLYRTCPLSAIPFKTTAEVEFPSDLVGQDRALEAIEFGTRIRHKGYNLFVLGQPGTGRHGAVRQALEEKAKGEKAAADWVYVNNFEEPHKPRVLTLPPGRGGSLRSAMRNLTDDLRTSIPSLFQGEDYQNRLQAVEETFHERQEEAFQELRQNALERNIALLRTPTGFALAPLKNGEVIKPEAFEKMEDAERAKIQADIEGLEAELEGVLKQIPKWDKERRDAVRQLNQEMTAFAIDQPLSEIRATFQDLDQVSTYLDDVRRDLVENVHAFIGAEIAQTQRAAAGQAGDDAVSQGNGFRRYQVNLIVGHDADGGAPVVYEDNPTLHNLVGRVEHLSHLGALETDFTLIKPGALHRANGGYLILDALKVLIQPMAWDSLKRALTGERINIESLGQALSLISTVSLEPEPIPLDIKIVMIGEPLLYYLLSTYDPEFPRLFKVQADFDDSAPRGDGGTEAYARLVAALVRQEDLTPFARDGVARVVEQASRMADDAERLSIRLEPVLDLMREADHLAREAGAKTVGKAHVQAAIDAAVRRADRIRERSQEIIERGLVLLDTDGQTVGQINGLSVIQLGGFAFGRPTRISARTRMGSGKVVDIEREVELGGPLHSKGVLILSGFLTARYALDRPLSLSASLVFEQTYGGVEGDSASSAELYALLSSLSELPIRQSLAVTGSVNQNGQVQAIGGVNEKIEGYFDICAKRGLTGDQGVLIPASNVQHLMLRDDVVQAVKDKRFHIYPVETIDQGIELLTGRRAGDRRADGTFPDGSVNRLVEDRLIEFADTRRAFAARRDNGRSGDDADSGK